ncbi:pyruvate-formate lyase-activating enzyme [Spirochaeta africana DSM 8902]|uniref:Pyruvate-formate lyase-activating enzyme n=2 Tax=Spirochaeta TaxID=146 RepID=H9UFY3_SPIAZ|nr:pyruvate-formate lyase-activating enzyme [Spirochaeta africana DSM 8902]
MLCAQELQHNSEGSVTCLACQHRCRIADGAVGICGVRENREGQLVSLMYGHPAAQHLDPIEKKPLYHVLPGTRVLSAGTLGCNMSCRWCQNCSIAAPPRGAIARMQQQPTVSPQELVEQACRSQAAGIAFTYNEPTVWIEYARHTAELARQRGLAGLWVSNGYLTPQAWDYLSPHLTAANIDLKAFSDRTCRRYSGSSLQPVLDSIVHLHRQTEVWVEVTMLIIPGVNDDPHELQAAFEFLVGLSPQIPLHLSGFHPAHRMQEHPATSRIQLLQLASQARQAGIQFVYLGNTGDTMDISCPSCGHTAIQRNEYPTDGSCRACGSPLPGVWEVRQ